MDKTKHPLVEVGKENIQCECSDGHCVTLLRGKVLAAADVPCLTAGVMHALVLFRVPGGNVRMDAPEKRRSEMGNKKKKKSAALPPQQIWFS